MALLLVATAACLVPAWRAARADPVTTLKGG
jgi:ABC-type lipoprotein release transport system permease subunit